MDVEPDVNGCPPKPKRILNLKNVKNSKARADNALATQAAAAVENSKAVAVPAGDTARVINLSHIKKTAEPVFKCAELSPAVDMENVTDEDDTKTAEANEPGRIRPNTAFLTRFVGSIERSNCRQEKKQVASVELASDIACGGEDIDIEAFRLIGRQKISELADFYGFSVQLRVNAALPVGFKRKKPDLIAARMGEATPATTDSSIVSELLGRSPKKRNKKQKVSQVNHPFIMEGGEKSVFQKEQVDIQAAEPEAIIVHKPRERKVVKPTGAVNLFKNAVTRIKQ